MNDQRAQDPGLLMICQHCGVVLRKRGKTCRDCGGITAGHSPTVIPVLVVNKKPAIAPQHLKPENDPLLVERVVVRCKFNEAMTPKPRRFHGSRAFLFDNGDRTEEEKPAAPSAPVQNNEPAAEPAGPDFFSARSQRPNEGQQPVLAALNDVQDPGVRSPDQTNSDGAPPRTEELASGNAPPASTGDDTTSPGPPRQESIVQSLFEPSSNEPQGSSSESTAAAQSEVPEPAVAGGSAASATGDTSPLPQQDSGRQPVSSESKLVRQAMPSYMVADWLLLVVQENDGQTLSLTHTIEGAESEPVFGLLPSSGDFNIAPAQAPDTSVALSANALSFHDANIEEEDYQQREQQDAAVNIDSRLAFEEGISRISALRLQGALAKSGVLGFENANSKEDLRRKFTRKVETPGSGEEADNAITDEGTEPARPRERSVFRPKSALTEGERIEIKPKLIEDEIPTKPQKNPFAMVGAVAGILLVVAVIGVFAVHKLGSLSHGSQPTPATAGGAPRNGPSLTLPGRWRVVLMRTQETQTYFQDFTLDVNQNGDSISANSKDAIGDFTLTGEIAGGTSISLQKQYDSAGYIWPIMFSGQLTQGQDGSFATGTYSWRKSDFERVQGTWTASAVQEAKGIIGIAANWKEAGPGGKTNWLPEVMHWSGQQGGGQRLAGVAWVNFAKLLAIGVISFVFVKLFSRQGNLNRRRKKRHREEGGSEVGGCDLRPRSRTEKQDERPIISRRKPLLRLFEQTGRLVFDLRRAYY